MCAKLFQLGATGGGISGATGTDFDLISRHFRLFSTCLSLCLCVHCNVHATIRFGLLVLLRCNLLPYDDDVALVLCIQSKLVVVIVIVVSDISDVVVVCVRTGCRKCFASNPF